MAVRRSALVGLLLLPVLVSCATTPPTPSADSTPQPAEVSPPLDNAVDPAESPTPSPLPAIPDPQPNEIVRVAFATGPATSTPVEHAFTGQPVALHVMCASHDGEVEARLMVDGEIDTASTIACTEPHFTAETSLLTAGAHTVSLEIEATDGANGVAYLVEGDS